MKNETTTAWWQTQMDDGVMTAIDDDDNPVLPRHPCDLSGWSGTRRFRPGVPRRAANTARELSSRGFWPRGHGRHLPWVPYSRAAHGRPLSRATTIRRRRGATDVGNGVDGRRRAYCAPVTWDGIVD